MSFMLKIVEGPNKGAEIALPEGVTVTLGRSDSCDIILADQTLPDEPMKIAATAGGVTLDGEPLEQLLVVERGATALAVGPEKGVWGKLKWPAKAPAAEAAPPAAETPPPEASKPEPPVQKKRHGCLTTLLLLLLIAVVFGALGWYFRDEVRPYAEKARPQLEQAWQRTKPVCQSAMDRAKSLMERMKTREEETVAEHAPTIDEVIERFRLTRRDENGRIVLTGDFATRAERLMATAEAYATQPGVELDFSDDETLRTAAEATLAMMPEPDLTVAAATNRIVALAGKAADLARTRSALAADLPKLRQVDCSAVEQPAAAVIASAATPPSATAVAGPTGRKPQPVAAAPSLPVCGILTSPYPCLVLKSGMRIMEGAPFGEWTVAKIEPDSVVLTNAGRSVTWRP